MKKPPIQIATAIAATVAGRIALSSRASAALGIVALGASAAAGATGHDELSAHLGAVALGYGIGAVLPRSLRASYTGMLDARELAAHPDQNAPAALVFLPDGFDPTVPYEVLIYYRGWSSCVEVLAGSDRSPCSPGGRERQHSDIAGQVQRSGRNMALVMPELLVEQPTSNPGRLVDPMAVTALVDAALALAPTRDPIRLADARRLWVASHSGGYVAAARAVDGLPVTDVLLLDSLYGEVRSFADFARRGGRVASIFTEGTTASKSAELVEIAGGSIFQSPEAVSVDQWRIRVMAHHTSVGHSLIPLTYLEPWLKTRD
jgi:hypothetical protein